MVLFGQNPSQGTLLKASQFLAGMLQVQSTSEHTILTNEHSEELPVRLAHRVKELDELPHNLSAMPSINKVKNWYAQSFEVRSGLDPVCMRRKRPGFHLSGARHLSIHRSSSKRPPSPGRFPAGRNRIAGVNPKSLLKPSY